jgi:hypothetical protein
MMRTAEVSAGVQERLHFCALVTGPGRRSKSDGSGNIAATRIPLLTPLPDSDRRLARLFARAALPGREVEGPARRRSEPQPPPNRAARQLHGPGAGAAQGPGIRWRPARAAPRRDRSRARASVGRDAGGKCIAQLSPSTRPGIGPGCRPAAAQCRPAPGGQAAGQAGQAGEGKLSAPPGGAAGRQAAAAAMGLRLAAGRAGWRGASRGREKGGGRKFS